jgi:hypothetical protein
MYGLVLLTALLRRPAYGYALKKTAGLIFGNSALHNNLIYPSLKRFLQHGWVEQSSVLGNRGQQRKQYRNYRRRKEIPAGTSRNIQRAGSKRRGGVPSSAGRVRPITPKEAGSNYLCAQVFPDCTHGRAGATAGPTVDDQLYRCPWRRRTTRVIRPGCT